MKQLVRDRIPAIMAATTRPQPGPALHLLRGRWVAACPSCGFELAAARSQARCERHAARRACPVCPQVPGLLVDPAAVRELLAAVHHAGPLARRRAARAVVVEVPSVLAELELCQQGLGEVQARDAQAA